MEFLFGYLAFSVGVNLLMFLVAYAFKTDKLTDISYSLTFIAIVSYGYFNTDHSVVTLMLMVLVTIWGLRLGGYLFYRIHAIGRDQRFDDIRENFRSFFLFWLMQGLTCFIVMIPVLWVYEERPLFGSILLWPGVILALMGLVLEAVADAQKFTFKRKHPDAFMKAGVWGYLQHPNYAGELLFWWGIFLACLPFAPWYIIIGPLWISLIILRFSGISLLQEKWQDKYGNDPAFIAYQQKTSRLIPKIY